MKAKNPKRGSGKPIVFGRVIAEREYRVGRARLLLQVGTPHPASSTPDWYCPVRLVRDGKTSTKRAFGIDAVQALQLGLQLARVLLQLTSPKINWDAGQRPGDVGIDRTITSALGVEFAAEMEAMVESAYLERSLELSRLHKKRRARR